MNLVVPTFGVRTGRMKFGGRTWYVAAGDDLFVPTDTSDARSVESVVRGCNEIAALFVIGE